VNQPDLFDALSLECRRALFPPTRGWLRTRGAGSDLLMEWVLLGIVAPGTLHVCAALLAHAIWDRTKQVPGFAADLIAALGRRLGVPALVPGTAVVPVTVEVAALVDRVRADIAEMEQSLRQLNLSAGPDEIARILEVAEPGVRQALEAVRRDGAQSVPLTRAILERILQRLDQQP
jgi:hypothetical protein